jgi:hypothetical protein
MGGYAHMGFSVILIVRDLICTKITSCILPE